MTVTVTYSPPADLVRLPSDLTEWSRDEDDHVTTRTRDASIILDGDSFYQFLSHSTHASSTLLYSRILQT